MTNTNDSLSKFHWEPQPAAQAIVNELIGAFLRALPAGHTLAERMKTETGTRFLDWLDHLAAPADAGLEARMKAAGFVADPTLGVADAFVHPGAIFPTIILERASVRRAALKVESVDDFLFAHGLSDDPSSDDVLVLGQPLNQIRMARAFRNDQAELWAVERHGSRSLTIPDFDAKRAIASVRHREALSRRKRDFATDEAGFAHTMQLVDAAIAEVGRGWACDLFFFGERRYWMTRNAAARFQKSRQDRLGLGWANHDHHTYRSSRHCYHQLIGLLERLGFHCRERFYAGHEANWGAQVLEAPETGITIFADVDMSPDELQGDFPHLGFKTEMPRLGTIGIWCGLHGEAALQAGMHHLECQFDWHGLKAQLEREGEIKMLEPFTTFPYLRQCFTVGEVWTVDPRRVRTLLDRKLITQAEADKFLREGATGSHLENLERNDGFKGFNQQGVSDIISRTDPRKALARSDA
jgi:hypothetical protein